MNASIACTLVSRIIYDDEMTASSMGSNCLNAENACFNHGISTSILTLIWTIWMRSEMKILSFCMGDCLSFEHDLLNLSRHDEDPWDLKYKLLLDHDRCLHLSSLLGDLGSSFCFGVQDLDKDLECLPLEWGGD